MKCIHFIIDIRELKIIKVFKNSAYIDTLKSREDSLYLFVIVYLSIKEIYVLLLKLKVLHLNLMLRKY